MVNRIWPTAVVGKVDSVSSLSASACHIGGPNSVNPGQFLLVYGKSSLKHWKNGKFLRGKWAIFEKIQEKTQGKNSKSRHFWDSRVPERCPNNKPGLSQRGMHE